MRVFIGLDGGGTGCRAQAELEDGRRTEVRAGPAANVHSDPEGATHAIAALLAAVLAEAQRLTPAQTLAPPQVVLGLAGASETGAEAMLRATLPYPVLRVLGDIDIALKGAFGAADGIVMAIGTGSVLAAQRGGQMQRLGGYGFLLGDEGSGAWIGRTALSRALYAQDRLGPAGPLTDALWARFSSVAQMLAFAKSARPADFAALAPAVLAHDRARCPVAGAILDAGCAYLLRAIVRLQAGRPDVPVAPMGGLGTALLGRIVAQGGAHLRTVTPKGNALDGALWQARHGMPPKEEFA